MIAACLVCLSLAQLPAVDGPLARASRAAFTQYTDAERVEREAARRKREHADADRLNHATWVYVATAGADWTVTAACIDDATCGDRSRAGLFLYGAKPGAAVPLGLAIDGALVYVLRELLAPEHPRLAEIALYVLSGARVVVTTTTVYDLRHRR